MVILLLLLVVSIITTSTCSGPPLAPALYVFGDSLFDNGNNNLLPTLARANFHPYGVDFAKGRPTGRFNNGRIIPDFIAEFLRLPYPPPVLRFRKSTPLTGLNYASSACGILPQTGMQLGKCLTLDDQIDLFEKTVKRDLPKHLKTANELPHYLSKSTFIVSTGNDDYLEYLKKSSKRYTPQAFATHILDALSQRFERLYKLGARKIVMFEIGPLGCLPFITRSRDNPKKKEGKCVEESNEIVKYFNDQLPMTLRNLTSYLHGSIFVNGHANWLGYDAILNPSNYGLKDTSNPCCRAWKNGTLTCIPLTSPCSNPNHNFFFDGYHLSESVCSVIASRCITDSSVCFPPLKHLIHI